MITSASALELLTKDSVDAKGRIFTPETVNNVVKPKVVKNLDDFIQLPPSP